MVRAAAHHSLVKFAAVTADSITGKPYFYGSDCGLYTVTIPISSGPYGAWRVIRNAEGKRRAAILVGYHPSAKTAKQACEDHYVANP